MIKSKYGFSIGEKVLFTYSSGETTIFEIKSFDKVMSNGESRLNSVCFTAGTWDYVDRISRIQKYDGSQLLFNFM